MMQLKRIIVSFLVAVMMISMAFVAVSAADDSASFGIAVSTADAEGNIEVTPGKSVDVDIKITNNPGISSLNFEVLYDVRVLTLVNYTFNEEAYSLGDLGEVIPVADRDADGFASVFVFTDPDVAENTAEDVIVTLHFTVAQDFQGNKAAVMINAENIAVFAPSGDQIEDVATSASCSSGHTPAEAVIENEVSSTCKDEGTYDSVIYCSVCNVEISREEKTIPVSEEHTPAEAVVENEKTATCIAEGSYDSVIYCSVCDAELSRVSVSTEIIPHTYVVCDDFKAPTCTVQGATATIACECGDVLVESVEIPVLPHTAGAAVKENETVADCENAGGYDLVHYCEICKDELFRETVVIGALGHTVKVNEGKAPTCTEKGTTGSIVCEACDAVLVAAEEIAVIPHTAKAVEGKAPTCTEKGTTGSIVCEACDAVLVAAEEIAVIPHTAGKAVEEKKVAADCTTAGSYDLAIYCTECEAELSRETVAVAALGHTAELVAAVAPTCTEAGKTAGLVCSVCGETTVAQETIAALGHTWTDATCTDAKTCSVCNATEGEANGHTYTNDCDADCDVCGETRTPAAHAYGEWKVVTEATKKAEGKQEKTCSVCGNVESEVIPMVKGGCNSVMGALAVVAMTMVGAAVVIRKKED